MAAAIYIHAKKNRGYLQRLPVDSRRLKSNQYKMMKYGVSDRQSALIFNMQETTDSRDEENLTMIQELDPTHLWKKMIEEQKEELSYTDKIRRNIKIYETLLAILAFISIIISIVEYEAKYYKAYFKDRYEIPNYQYYQKEALEKILDENYDGNPFRVILSILSLFMVWFSYLSNKNSYILKYEEKKVNESK